MLEKEVKQYKRGNSFTYRIDLSKKDNFQGGEKVMLLTLEECDEFINTIEDLKNQLNDKENIISDLKTENNNIKLDISKEVDKRNEEIAKKNDEIKSLIDENQIALQKCYDTIDEKDKALNKSNEEIRLERDKADELSKKSHEEIRLERERTDKMLLSKDDEIKRLNSEVEDNNKKLVAYRLVIERYKSRGFIDRLLNRKIDVEDKISEPAATYVLESDNDDK